MRDDETVGESAHLPKAHVRRSPRQASRNALRSRMTDYGDKELNMRHIVGLKAYPRVGSMDMAIEM